MVHGVAYNFSWQLDYIVTTFNEKDMKELLENAMLFNPWVDSKKDTSEDIPADVRKQLMEQRKKWEQEHEHSEHWNTRF